MDIILISMDTLRADRLGCYGLDKNTSPYIDELASDAVLFEKAYSHSPNTRVSHYSMLTSLHVLTHGVTKFHDKFNPSSKIKFLSEILKSNDFKTAGFVGGGLVTEVYGFSKGFDTWVENRSIKDSYVPTTDWLRNNKGNRFFLFFHFYDVHRPYLFREKYRELYNHPDYLLEHKQEIKKFVKASETKNFARFFTDSQKGLVTVSGLAGAFELDLSPTWIDFLANDWEKIPEYKTQIGFVRDSYDAGVRWTDDYLGQFFMFLKNEGLWDNTLIIFTSDHGEELMDNRCIGHGRLPSLYDTLLHIPLIIKPAAASGIKACRVSAQVESIDIMPTILDILNIDFKGQMQGKSLLDLMKHPQGHFKDVVFAAISGGKTMTMAKTGFQKYVQIDSNGITTDMFLEKPNDSVTNEIQIDNPVEAHKNLKNILMAHMKSCGELFLKKYSKGRLNVEKRSSKKKLDKLENQLRALGYLQ